MKKRTAFLGVLWGICSLFINVASAQDYTLGVFPGAETSQTDLVSMMNEYLPLAQYLTRETGEKVRFVPVRVPKLAIQSMNKHDGYSMFFGPPVFAVNVMQGFEPFVVENSRIRAAFVVMANSKLKKLEDITNATKVGMPPPPLLLAVESKATMAKLGVKLKPDFLHYTTGQDALLSGIATGFSDVAVLRDRQADAVLKKSPGKYRIIGYSVDAPGFAFIVSRKLDPKFLQKLKKALLKLNTGPLDPVATDAKKAFHGDQLADATNDDFAKLTVMMKNFAK